MSCSHGHGPAFCGSGRQAGRSIACRKTGRYDLSHPTCTSVRSNREHVPLMRYDEVVSDMNERLDLRVGAGAYSRLLAHQLALGWMDRSIDGWGVLDAIGHLQGTWPRGPHRAPDQFKGPILKGLWKLHYASARFIPKNLENEAKSPESQRTLGNIAEATHHGSDPSKHVYDLIIGGYGRRAAVGLTGEWVVFAKDAEARNYFLTLAQHQECERNADESSKNWRGRSDRIIYERACEAAKEFPHLAL